MLIASKTETSSMQIAMIDDEIVSVARLGPERLDRGTFFGDGVYEVMRSKSGRLFAMDDHLARFKHSLASVDITGVDIDLIGNRITRAYQASAIADAKIYFHITRGSAPRGHLCGDIKANFFLTVEELPDFTNEKNNGIAVLTCPDLRWKRCDIKSLNLLPNVLAKRLAAKQGCDEAVFVDDDGFVTEGASSAFFAVRGKVLQTAPLSANILGSVSRHFILKLSGSVGLKELQKSLTYAEAAGADELFVSTSARGILGVVKFDAETIGDGRVGKYTKLLSESLDRL